VTRLVLTWRRSLHNSAPYFSVYVLLSSVLKLCEILLDCECLRNTTRVKSPAHVSITWDSFLHHSDFLIQIIHPSPSFCSIYSCVWQTQLASPLYGQLLGARKNPWLIHWLTQDVMIQSVTSLDYWNAILANLPSSGIVHPSSDRVSRTARGGHSRAPVIAYSTARVHNSAARLYCTASNIWFHEDSFLDHLVQITVYSTAFIQTSPETGLPSPRWTEQQCT